MWIVYVPFVEATSSLLSADLRLGIEFMTLPALMTRFGRRDFTPSVISKPAVFSDLQIGPTVHHWNEMSKCRFVEDMPWPRVVRSVQHQIAVKDVRKRRPLRAIVDDAAVNYSYLKVIARRTLEREFRYLADLLSPKADIGPRRTLCAILIGDL